MGENYLILFLVALIFATSACVDSQEVEREPGNETLETEEVTETVMVGEMYFNQIGLRDDNVIESDEGASITFYNEGEIEHTITIEELGIDQVIEPEETFELHPEKSIDGSSIECTYHENHQGNITLS